MKRLDKVVTHQPSLMVWDSVCFPNSAEEEHWKEECLSYYLGNVVKHGGVDARNLAGSSKCGGVLWQLHTCPAVQRACVNI